jgi:hypothetical protein
MAADRLPSLAHTAATPRTRVPWHMLKRGIMGKDDDGDDDDGDDDDGWIPYASKMTTMKRLRMQTATEM